MDFLNEYDLEKMLNRLNEACGTDKPLTLAETQEIRGLIEQLAHSQKGKEK